MEKVEQVLKYGSIYQSFIQEFIDPNDVLLYLLDQEVTIRTMVAYYFVCKFSETQVLKSDDPEINDRHFMELNQSIQYIAIYTIYDYSDSVPMNVNLLIERKKSSMWNMMMNPQFSRQIYNICGKNVNDDITAEDISLAVLSRNMEVLLKNDITIQNWVSDDMVSMIDPEDVLDNFNLILTRIKFLQEFAPLYWDDVAQPSYSKLMDKSNITPESPISWKDLQSLQSFFPSVTFDIGSELRFNIGKLSTIVQAYILGFPIHLYIPTTEQIQQTLNSLDELGVKEYAKTVYDRNRKWLEGDIYPGHPAPAIVNEQDVLGNSVFKYSPFDIVKYYDDSRIYLFSRQEFDNLVKTRKNHWTNNELHGLTTLSLKTRSLMAYHGRLPKSQTLSKLLRMAEKGDLCQVENTQNSQNTQNLQPSQNLQNVQNLQPSQSVTRQQPDFNQLFRNMISGPNLGLAYGLYVDNGNGLEYYTSGIDDLIPPVLPNLPPE